MATPKHSNFLTIKIHIYLYKCDVQSLEYKLIDHDMAKWIFLDKMSEAKMAEADIPFIEKLKLI